MFLKIKRRALTDFHLNAFTALRRTSTVESLTVVLTGVSLGYIGKVLRRQTGNIFNFK